MMVVTVILMIQTMLGGTEGAELEAEVRVVHLQIEGKGEVHGGLGEGRNEAYHAVGLPETREAEAGLPEIVEVGAGLLEIIEAGAGLPETEEAGAGLPEIEEAGAGLPICVVLMSSVLRIRDERRDKCNSVLTSVEAGAIVECLVVFCTMILARVMNQGGKRANSSWSFLIIPGPIFVMRSSGSLRKLLIMSMVKLEVQK